MALIDKLTAIGDAIRLKTGKSDTLTLDQMPTEIASIETGGGVKNLFNFYAKQVNRKVTSTGSTAYWFFEIPLEAETTYYIQAENGGDYCYTYIVTDDGESSRNGRNNFIAKSAINEGTFTTKSNEHLLLIGLISPNRQFTKDDGKNYKIMLTKGDTRQVYSEFVGTKDEYIFDTPFAFGGMNAEKVAEYDEVYTLADTSFVVGETSSTTATTILATVANKYTSPSIAINDNDVVVVQTLYVVPEYNANAVNKARAVSFATTHLTFFAKRRNSGTNPSSQTTRTSATQSSSWVRYYNSSGSETFTSATYGMYGALQSASVASSTAASTTIRVTGPGLYARANTSYASVDNQKAVVDCTWYWHIDVYLVDKSSTHINALVNSNINMLFPPISNLGLDDESNNDEIIGEEITEN